MTFLRCLLSWILYWSGDITSRLCFVGKGYAYRQYNWLMTMSGIVQGHHTGKWWPWGGYSKDCAGGQKITNNIIIGYMCGVDWQYALGRAQGGNTIYASAKDCARCKKCTDECGIVEVRVSLSKWVKECSN